jgi:hypothetical protein
MSQAMHPSTNCFHPEYEVCASVSRIVCDKDRAVLAVSFRILGSLSCESCRKPSQGFAMGISKENPGLIDLVNH